jgi:hypothetical protein
LKKMKFGHLGSALVTTENKKAKMKHHFNRSNIYVSFVLICVTFIAKMLFESTFYSKTKVPIMISYNRQHTQPTEFYYLSGAVSYFRFSIRFRVFYKAITYQYLAT